MSALDKSLDDIIKSTGGKSGARKFSLKKKPAKVGKRVGTAQQRKPIAFKKATPVANPRQIKSVDLSYATKVVAHGFPKDIKYEGIKEFFQTQVGGVQKVELSYNERGQFKGTATIIFKSSKFATTAVDKYNGVSVDQGSGRLRMELIVDPSKKPLALRLGTNVSKTPKVVAAKKALAKKKAEKPQQKKKPAKKAKKSVEELDQEMTDYFEAN